jgi:mono/diheme cytochrome c family protein
MKEFATGAVTTMIVLFAVFYFYFASGMAPVAASDRPIPFEKKLAHLALHARLEKEMPRQVPLSADDQNLTAGAHIYMEHCAVCHGVPDKEQSAMAKGEFPPPPHLFRGKGVTNDSPGETYWKVSNGIRLTGMPGFSQQLSATQIWQVSLLLAHARQLPASAKTVLVNANTE